MICSFSFSGFNCTQTITWGSKSSTFFDLSPYRDVFINSCSW